VARSISFFADSHTFGGAEQSMLTLIQALDRSEWRPTLLLSESGVAPLLAERASALEVPVRFVEPMPLGAVGLRRMPAFAAMLARERPEVFHATLGSPLSAKFALTAAVLARVRAVVGTVQLVPPFPISQPSRVQLRTLVSRLGRVLAVSGGIQYTLVHKLGWPGREGAGRLQRRVSHAYACGGCSTGAGKTDWRARLADRPGGCPPR
jgi:hypothetical protein